MRLAQLHRPLIVTAAVMVLIAILAGAGLVVDDRVLLGVPVWLKPFKFAVSITIYAVTIAWLLSLLDRRRRLGWWLGTVIAGAMIGEMVIIVGQASRGRQSHFNNQTPLDSTLYSVMGATIAIAWMCTLVLAILLLIQRLPDRAHALAVRFGLLVGLGGMMVGFLMTLPTKAQLDLPEGEAPTIVGAHSVGVTDGGPGLPLVNWSTTGGDLRVGHFVGVHSLQAMLVVAILVTWLVRDADRRTRLVLVAGATYAGLFVLVTWQALRGQPVTEPDPSTLIAFCVLAAACAIGAALAWLRPTPADG